MVFLENVYYIIIVAWTLYYIMNTFFSLGSGLPWSDCEKGGQSVSQSLQRKLFQLPPGNNNERPCFGLNEAALAFHGPFRAPCRERERETLAHIPTFPFLYILAGTWADERCFNPKGNVSFLDSEAYLKYNFTEKETITPVESYWK